MKIATKTFSVVSVKVLGSALSLLTTLVLSRILGVHDYGSFVYVLAIVNILSVVATLGFSDLAVREIAKLTEARQWTYLKGFLAFGIKTIFSLSIIVIALAFLGNFYFVHEIEEVNIIFKLALILVPIVALNGFRQSILRGLHRYVLCQVPENVVKPLVLIFFVVFFSLTQIFKINVVSVMILFVVSSIIAFVSGGYFLKSAVPTEIYKANAQYKKNKWKKSARQLFLISCCAIVNSQAAIIMLGYFENPESSALFSVANQLAMLILYVFIALQIYYAPTVACLHQKKDKRELQRKTTFVTWIGTLFALPVFLALVFFGNKALLLYGDTFAMSYNVLRILAVGYLANVILGPVNIILIMTNHEKVSVYVMSLSTILNLLLSVVLIPAFGIIGAAIAFSSSMVLWNIVLFFYVFRFIRINSSIINKLV